jgi:hypothetical protein
MAGFLHVFVAIAPKLVIETLEWQAQRIGIVSSSPTDL